MKLTAVHESVLYSLGQFYQSINQPLTEKPVRLRTSKIVFIEVLLQSKILPKQKRAVYKNLESLERKKLIEYYNHMIAFTPKGMRELQTINKRIRPFVDIENYFRTAKPIRKLQTIIEG